MRKDVSKDYDDTTYRPTEWWGEVGKTSSPSPYETASWTYLILSEEVVPDDD